MKSISFVSLAYDSKKKRTHQEKFLQEMDGVIPREELIEIIKKYYLKVNDLRRNSGRLVRRFLRFKSHRMMRT